MTDEERADLPRYRWMESRIPRRDALCAFVPSESELDPAIETVYRRIGQSVWIPVPGGHRVLMPLDGGPYDPERFTIEPRAWDHEHCDACGEHIPAMTLCRVTVPGEPYVLLCSTCYGLHVASKQRKAD